MKTDKIIVVMKNREKTIINYQKKFEFSQEGWKNACLLSLNKGEKKQATVDEIKYVYDGHRYHVCPWCVDEIVKGANQDVLCADCAEGLGQLML